MLSTCFWSGNIVTRQKLTAKLDGGCDSKLCEFLPLQVIRCAARWLLNLGLPVQYAVTDGTTDAVRSG